VGSDGRGQLGYIIVIGKRKKHFAGLAECFYKYYPILVGNIGKKCHLACSLYSYSKLSLVKSAGAGNTSGEDLCTLGDELSELSNILVINSVYLVLTEDANLLSSVHRTESRALCIVSIH